MDFNKYSFHDSKIIEVYEKTNDQILEFKINYVENWDEIIFVNKILRFINVTFYSINEIPYSGGATILKINDLGIVKKKFGDWEIIRNKIEMETTAGNRIIEFESCEFN